jgi:predicted permease
MLALAGGVAGTLLAYWAIRVLIVLTPVKIPRLGEAGLDVRVLLFTLVVCGLAGLLFGIAPALAAASTEPRQKLAEGGRGGTSTGGKWSTGLVVIEIALAVVLSGLAGLTMRSYVNLQSISPGFDMHHTIRLELLPEYTEQTLAAVTRAQKTITAAVASLPGVEATGIAVDLPLGGWQQDFRFRLRKEQSPDPNQARSALIHRVSPGYFRTMGIPIKRGRGFVAGDKEGGAQGVVVVNEQLARQSFAGDDPIGRYIFSGPKGEFEIVGVAGDVRHSDLSRPPQAELYLHSNGGTLLVVRSMKEPKLLAAEVRQAIHAVSPEVGVTGVATLEQTVRQAGARPRFWMILTGLFAFISLAMAAAGVYALVSQSVRRRVSEFAIRMALGARPADIRNLVLGQTLRRALVGVVAGVAASLALARVLSSLLFEVKPNDPLSLAMAVMIVTATALLASYLPARWAARADPASSLREE